MEKEITHNLGEYIGAYIYMTVLPTLSTNILKSPTVIEVTKDEKDKYVRLRKIWDMAYAKNKLSSQAEWNKLKKFDHILMKKYLPEKLVCRVPKFSEKVDISSLKQGIREYLWDCDVCNYHIDHDRIEIDFRGGWCNIITLTLDVNEELINSKDE